MKYFKHASSFKPLQSRKDFDQINNLLLMPDREMNFNFSNFASTIYNYLRQFFLVKPIN